jgi:NitT/TauT family transport system substrate-binding protein
MSLLTFDQDPSTSLSSLDAETTVHPDSSALASGLIQGDLDIAVMAPNVAAMAYHANGAVRIAAVNTQGGLFLVSRDPTITSIGELGGHTVWSGGPGETPNVVMDIILDHHGLTDQVSVDYEPYPLDAIATVSSSSADLFVIAEPFASGLLATDPRFIRVVDLSEEFSRITGSPVISSVTVVNTDFEAAHRSTVEEFLQANQQSSHVLALDQQQAATMMVANQLAPDIDTALDALPRCQVDFIQGDEAKSLVLGFLSVLYVFNPEMVGNNPPGDRLFYG